MSWGYVFTTQERRYILTKNTSIAQCLAEFPARVQEQNELRNLISTCSSPRMRILWEIFFDTGMDNIGLLEDRIYQYGSMVKEKDQIGREIFLGAIALLQEIKNTTEI